MGDYARFDFSDSYYRDVSVISLIKEKLPVSISLGLWTTLFTYLISIPWASPSAAKRHTIDIWSSGAIILAYAIPGFLFAVLLIVLFAGGSYFDVFPLRGLTSENFAQLTLAGKILDYLWHIFLPVLALTIGAFATTTLLTKNSFLDEISKQYVITARAKGLTENRILYGHVFRNAMLIVVAGFPGAFIGAFFTGSLLIETIFSLDGLGLLSYESIINRDYPVVFASLYIFGLLGLVVTLISDLTYVLVDPRIDFESREGCEHGQIRIQTVPDQPKALGQFQGQPPRLFRLMDLSGMFTLTLFAELIANDKPLLVKFDDAYYTPVFKAYAETAFGGDFETEADYRDPYVQELIEAKGWMVWPVIRYGHDTINLDLSVAAPAPPSAENWLGTDDQGRDVLARLIYGFRISVLFGLILTVFSSLIGVAIGAVQGYFGGWTDLLTQRFIEIWTSVPSLYLLIIIAAIIEPSFWILLGILLLFSWVALVGVVRAEFLRARNFEYVQAARALGAKAAP